MRSLYFFLLLISLASFPASFGCGSSHQSEEAAKELVQQEDAAADIDAEIAAEKAEEAE